MTDDSVFNPKVLVGCETELVVPESDLRRLVPTNDAVTEDGLEITEVNDAPGEVLDSMTKALSEVEASEDVMDIEMLIGVPDSRFGEEFGNTGGAALLDSTSGVD